MSRNATVKPQSKRKTKRSGPKGKERFLPLDADGVVEAPKKKRKASVRRKPTRVTKIKSAAKVSSSKIAVKTKKSPFWLAHIPEAMIGVGLLLISVSFIHTYLKTRSLSLSQQVVASYVETKQQELPKPRHIFIKWFLDVDIEDMAYTDNQWGVSDDKASYLIQSARPGEAGNIIVYGHNKRTILGNIRALKGYETITVTLSNGSTRLYKISKMVEVDPSKVTYLEPTSSEVLTLYTCSGFLDSKRFIVQATPVEIQK
jgi:LPXTG-site transpeptidase (sortase) family protein